MKQIKIIFFDIDGTLVNPQTGSISDLTKLTINRLSSNGILLCIATGRPPASLPDFTGLPIDIFCTCNGALCYNGTETIISNPISTENVQKLIQNAANIGRPISIALRDRLAANGTEKDLEDYYGLCGLKLTAADNFNELSKQNVYQLMVGFRPSDQQTLLSDVEDVKLAISWERAADIIPAVNGKGAAIQKILEYYQLKPEEALAFGDSYNDMEMLQAVGTGVAMGNGVPELKDLANDVCKSVSEEGIYHYCLSHKLI